MSRKVLIVGQGIAGTVLGDALEQEGFDVYVVDEAPASSSSLVAAGIFNPVISRRFTATWMADELMPSAHEYYRAFGQRYKENVLYPYRSYLVFENATHANEWSLKEKDANLKKYISDELPVGLPEAVNNSFGGLLVNGAGYVNTKVLISIYRQHLKNQKRLIEEKFEHLYITQNESGITYKDVKYDQLVFCEGWKALHNPWFDKIPFKPAKGEVLTLEIPDFDCPYILHRGKYLAPLGNYIYKAGATYEWKEIDEKLTTDGRDWLEKRIREMIRVPYKVINQEAGIRPSIADRRPVMDRHPSSRNMYIFNGLGTKGVSIAPYFAVSFAKMLRGEMEMPDEVRLSRFEKD